MLIIIFLDHIFKLYYSRKIEVLDLLKIGDTNYTIDPNSKENNGFIGFFDWLREDKSSIVGIRICYFEHQEYNRLLMRLPYVIPTFNNKCMEVLFTFNNYDPLLSGDQDFTNNYVYRSESGDFLFTFGLDHLTDIEVKSLIKQCVLLDKNSAN